MINSAGTFEADCKVNKAGHSYMSSGHITEQFTAKKDTVVWWNTQDKQCRDARIGSNQNCGLK